MGIFNKKMPAITPEELIDIFINEYINIDNSVLKVGISQLKNDLYKDVYHDKEIIYRLALLLMNILIYEKRKKDFYKVRIAFENKFYKVNNDQNRKLVNLLKSAMSDLNTLISPTGKSKEFSWSMNWFKSIGIEISNPVDLALFAKYWMDQFSFIQDTFDNIKLKN